MNWIDVLITPFGEYNDTNEQVRLSVLHRAIKKHRNDMHKLEAYRFRLMLRYASMFCYWNWKHKA